jgi:TRAP transporter TAXI family solute receptor
MKKNLSVFLFGSMVSLIILLTFSSHATAAKRMVFTGGPAGGTFQIVANAVQTYEPIKALKDIKIKAQSSAGSVENLRKVNTGKAQFGVVYSGHVYLGKNGKLKNDDQQYHDVLALAYLYGAPAQLVVRANSGIKSTKALIGKKVGVGNAGSGAFANCELFFTHLGIWDKIERNAIGYNDAASAFSNNQLDAFWLFTAFPSGAVMMAAQTNEIALINLDKDAQESGFYKTYPYFTKLVVPAETYKGVNTNTPSFQDSTLWVANSQVPEDVVYKVLSILFSQEGLAYMANQKKTFKEMSIDKGIQGIVTPLHPGAITFWKEKGILK